MDRSQLISDLENVIKEHVDGDAGFSLQKHIESQELLPIDSMALFEIGMYLESHFGLRLDDERVMKMRDARLLIETVERHLSTQSTTD